MSQGDKEKYTDKQVRKARHIEENYEKRGIAEPEAKARAWATVNKVDRGGKKSGSGRGKRGTHLPQRPAGASDPGAGYAAASRGNAGARDDRGATTKGHKDGRVAASNASAPTAKATER